MSGGAGGPCPPSCGLPPGYFDKEEGRALLDRPPWNGPRHDLTVWLEVLEPELSRRLRERWSRLGKRT